MAFNLNTLASLTDLVKGGVVDPTPAQLQISAPLTVDNHQQHIVDEYTEGYGLLVVRELTGKILCASDHFLLAGLNESDQERFSMAYTIGDPVLRGGRGRRPRMFAYTGVLVDTEESGSGIAIWRYVYEHYLRSSSCVNREAIVEFMFRDQYRKGYVVGCNMTYDANNPQRAGIMWTMFVIGTDRAKS
jgi:hypothetical protein